MKGRLSVESSGGFDRKGAGGLRGKREGRTASRGLTVERASEPGRGRGTEDGEDRTPGSAASSVGAELKRRGHRKLGVQELKQAPSLSTQSGVKEAMRLWCLGATAGDGRLALAGPGNSPAFGRSSTAGGGGVSLWGGGLAAGGRLAPMASSSAGLFLQGAQRRKEFVQSAQHMGRPSERSQGAWRGGWNGPMCWQLVRVVWACVALSDASSITGTGQVRCRQDPATPSGRAASSSTSARRHQAGVVGQGAARRRLRIRASPDNGQDLRLDGSATEAYSVGAGPSHRPTAGWGGENHHGSTAFSGCEGFTVRRRPGQGYRDVETLQSAHSHHEPRPELAARQASAEIDTSRGGITCTRLGLLDGSSAGVEPSDKERSSGSVGCCREEYHGAGHSSRGRHLPYSSLLETDMQTKGRLDFGAAVCVADVGHRHGSSGRGSSQQGAMELRACRRSQCHSGHSAAGCVGRQTEGGCGKCVGRGDGQEAHGHGGAGGPLEDQPKMCPMVSGEHSSTGVQGSPRADGAGSRRKSSAVGFGGVGLTTSDHSGVCGGPTSAVHEGALGAAAGDHLQRPRVEVDETDDLPAANVAGVAAKATRVDCGDAAHVGSPSAMKDASPSSANRRAYASLEMDGTRLEKERREGGFSCRPASDEGERLARLQTKASLSAPTHGRLRLRGGGPTERATNGPPHARQDDSSARDSEEREAAVTQGCCLFWNARQLWVPEGFKREAGNDDSKAAYGKLDFLEQQLTWHEPWLITLLEVAGDVGRMRRLRQWFRQRGFGHTVFLLGEGSSRADGEGDAAQSMSSCTNGIVLAARKDLTILSAKRLAFRTFAVQVWHKDAHRQINVAIIHGSSIERGAQRLGAETEEDCSFAQQLHMASRWCSERQGALLMDANRVPCRNWRDPPSATMSQGDRALRAIAGWQCKCCVSRMDGEAASEAHFIGAQRDGTGAPKWTRWGDSGEGQQSKSRLDVGLQFPNEFVLWIEGTEVEPWLLGATGNRVSDHALVVFQIRLMGAGLTGEARPLPVNLGSRPRMDQRDDLTLAWVQMGRLTGKAGFLRKLQTASDRAYAAQLSRVQALVPLLRAAGVEAVRLAKKAVGEDRRSGRARLCFDDKGELHSWRQRLRVALACAKGKITCGLREWNILFHRRTGMRWLCPRFSQEDIAGVDWFRVVNRCRRQISRADRFLNRRQAYEDCWLADKCRTIEEQVGDGDLSAHVRTVWRMIGKKRGDHTRINELHIGDKKEARVLGVEDPDFLTEAGRIGEAFVNEMDRGAVPEAFAAWLEVFCTRFDTVGGADGAWSLKKDFTFEIFERTLRLMKGKAVGAGGLSVELLDAAVLEVRWAFYQAILSDIEHGRIAPAWRKVIYVLLRKPPPNDPAIISQRREIALMPQDLKILLQGVRHSTYNKIASRLDAAQYGWKKGVGCADPSLAVACVLDQARRLKHAVWLLYIDLANFFPAINRTIACSSELFVGLPEEVTSILSQIYGGQLGEPAHVACQYETGAGLGAPFQNGVGRLMGCPISPDSAKILLNSVLLAIKASVSGVQLWPFKGSSICQLAYADDWVGLFDEVSQLQKALLIWLTWAEVVGAKLGIKGFMKTVVSGVVYVKDRPRTPPDPQLRDLEGKRIQLLPCDELYKHLGIPRAACADSRRSWEGSRQVTGVRDKIRAGISRLRQLRPGRTSPEQFMCISNVLLGSLGGFYLQSVAVAEEDLEALEREWRRCFNRFARRDPSSPAWPLYSAAATWRKGRTHLVRTGWAALFSSVSKLLADASESPAQAAVRSAIALSLHSWGCRKDPNSWNWAHLVDSLRTAVRRKGPRFIGDAWMLASSMMEVGRAPEASRGHRAEHLRVRKYGRWMGWEEAGHARQGPLHPMAEWHRGRSRTLFDPEAHGGLGLEPCLPLIQAHVVELNQLCTFPFRSVGGEGRWLLDRRQAVLRFPGLRSAACWGHWVAVVDILQRKGIQPVQPEAQSAVALRRYPTTVQGVHREELLQLNALAHDLRRARLGTSPQLGAEVYANQLRGIGTALPATHETREAVIRGGESTWIGVRLEDVDSERIIQWGKAQVGDIPAAMGDSWPQQAARWARMVHFRSGDGWPTWGASGEEIQEEELGLLPAAQQLAVRARLRLGREAAVIAEGFGEKLSGIRVAEDVQRRNWECLCHLQARLQFSHAFASDASEGELPFEPGATNIDEWGWPLRRTAAVAVKHSGGLVGGCLSEEEPSDSYVGELSALIAAMEGAPVGSRILIVLDSTSPVRAWLRFRSRGGRAQMQYKACLLLEALERAAGRHELVYLLWQRSHCGSPVNEWADLEAERIRLQGQPLLDSPCRSAGVFSLWPARCQGGLFRWAVAACEQAAHAHMKRHYRGDGCNAHDDDWDLECFQGELGAAANLLRDNRLMVADLGHVLGLQEREAAGKTGCCHGCAGIRGTWHHYAFKCPHPELWVMRRSWFTWILEHRISFDRLYLNKQVEDLVACLRDKEGRVAGSLRQVNDGLPGVRRLLCGFVTKEEAGYVSQTVARAAVQEMISGGLRLLCLAVRLEKTFRREVEVNIRNNNLLRRSLKGWRRVVDGSGPFRVAALRQIRLTRWALVVVGEARVADGSMSVATRNRLMRRTLAALAAAREEIETGCPPVGEEAIVLWCMQMKWWGRWAQKKECILPRRSFEAWSPALAEAMRAIANWEEELFTLELRWGGNDDASPRWYGDMQSIGCRFSIAYRAFWRMGGVRRLRAVCKRMRKEDEARQRSVLSDRLLTFLEVGTCSGGPKISIPAEQRMEVIIAPRVRKRQRTWDRERTWRSGVAADKRGRWAVDEVMEVRRTPSGRGWEVKVAWAGPFEDEWVRLCDLSADLREESWRRIQETWGSVEAEKRRERAKGGSHRRTGVENSCEARPPGVRKSPRLREVEAKRDKLRCALVVYQAPLAAPPAAGLEGAACDHGIRKAWGVHSRGKGKHVYVERWVRGGWKASVSLLTRLPSAIQDRIARYGRYDMSRDGASSSMDCG